MDGFDNYGNTYDPLYVVKREWEDTEEVLDSAGLSGHMAGAILQKRVDFTTNDVVLRLQTITKNESAADLEYIAKVTELRVNHTTQEEAVASYGSFKQGNYVAFDGDKIISVITGKFDE